MKRTMLAVVFLVACVSPSRSAIIEIPLPELIGEYSGESGATRTASVVLPMIPSVINGVSLRIGGTSTLGEVICQIHVGENQGALPLTDCRVIGSRLL